MKQATYLGVFNRFADLEIHKDILDCWETVRTPVYVVQAREIGVRVDFRTGPFLSLVWAVQDAKEKGYQVIRYTNGDDWIFKEELVQDRFRLATEEGIQFQGYNWFGSGSMDNFAVNELYLDIGLFGPATSSAQHYAQTNNHLCETMVAQWVKWLNPKFKRHDGREGDIGNRYSGDSSNNRWFNRDWQLLSHHDLHEKRQAYLGLRHLIPYRDQLESKPNFRAFLKPYFG